MMSISSVAAASAASSAASTARKSGLGALDQGDFLKLLTTQLSQQDPFQPVDNKEMLAQMAQFSSLAGQTEMGSTLTQIASKLDTLIAQQAAPTAA